MIKTKVCLISILVLAALPAFPKLDLMAAAQSPVTVQVPEDMGTASLPERKKAQLATRPQFRVFHDFRFADRLADTGIGFVHHIVDDAGPRYKAVHYDHGNGVSAADVDGDGLVDLYFLTQIGPNELWRNLGGGKFENVTGAAGVALEERVSVAGSFADVDNDGDPDLFVTTVGMGNVLFENDGGGKFTDVTKKAGLGYSGHSSTGHFFDYDNDGLVDLFLPNVGIYTTDELDASGYYVGVLDAFERHLSPTFDEASVLYRNLGGGRFEDVSEKALLVDRSWTGDAVSADFNGDGFRDLYVLNMQGDDRYYENVRGRFFVDRSKKLFPKTPFGTMGAKIFDWNGDGRLDLLLTDMHADMREQIGPEREKLKAPIPEGLQGTENSIFGNALFENTGEGFREVSDQTGVENYWPWGVSVDDLNADGWDDAFITSSMNYPFRYGVNTLLLNNRGERFLDSEFIVGVEPRAGRLVKPWFEIDCSGEAVEDGSKGAQAAWEGFGKGGAGAAEDEAGEGKKGGTEGKPVRHTDCGDQTGKVTVLASVGSRSSVIFDLEGDGDLDIVTNEFNAPPMVLVSDLAARRKVRFVQIQLQGTASNRDGLGAVVKVTSGGRERIKLRDGKSGYLSQSLLPLYFGLGDEETIDRIEVEWPSGRKQVVETAKPNTTIRIVEPSEAEESRPAENG